MTCLRNVKSKQSQVGMPQQLQTLLASVQSDLVERGFTTQSLQDLPGSSILLNDDSSDAMDVDQVGPQRQDMMPSVGKDQGWGTNDSFHSLRHNTDVFAPSPKLAELAMITKEQVDREICEWTALAHSVKEQLNEADKEFDAMIEQEKDNIVQLEEIATEVLLSFNPGLLETMKECESMMQEISQLNQID
jgi:hypothetical protein